MESPAVHLADYRPPAWAVESIELRFELHPRGTRVTARTVFRRLAEAPAPLQLDGEGFTTEALRLDGAPVPAAAFAQSERGLVLHAPPQRFLLEVVTRLDPADNTTLSGLYMSGGRFCTQCEAEGFRRITFALDRPDVMTRYSVRLEADAATFPTLLANGNPGRSGPLPGGRHFAEWHDPFPKPTYLFAVAAGAYETIRGGFTTRSGRRIELAIHVDPGCGDRAHFALGSLQRAMRWDEEVFAREYDLDLYQVVAVRDFNFGAMENKGLNIFNSAYVLADPATATDVDYEGIESVIGHEYFHNWTGNRITCRDWFQLSLKEGLTVFREQEFAAAMRSRAVQRIKDVRRLWARQFPEDQGPLAHPVRPASYRAIDNFYTATVYEKGAEVIRMVRTAIGEAAFARGMQLYFERRDGTASTVEDLLGCLADGAGADLSPFLAWYDQAGTPVLRVEHAHDPATGTVTLRLRQHTPPTPGQPQKRPLPLPLRVGFVLPGGAPLRLRRDGEDAPRDEHLVVFADAAAELHFHGAAQPPVPAVLRGYSAPVVLEQPLPVASQLVQMAHDPDQFTRWHASQRLARDLMLGAGPSGPDVTTTAAFARALGAELDRAAADPAFAALALRLPDLGDLIQHSRAPDPDLLAAARDGVRRTLAATLRPRLEALASAPADATFELTAHAAGARALRAAALDLLAALGAAVEPLLERAFAAATDMTGTMAALEALGTAGGPGFDRALAAFHARFRHDPLVLDKWFAVQATAPRADALARVGRLLTHPDFELQNPNRVRALARAFATGNPQAFHAADGGGYRFLTGIVAAVDPRNPALAAKLLQGFDTWRRFDASRRAHAEAALRSLATPALSPNTREMLDLTLA